MLRLVQGPLITAIPYWWRFMQCMRRCYDAPSPRQLVPQLVNSGKYFISLTSISMAAVGCEHGCRHFYFEMVRDSNVGTPVDIVLGKHFTRSPGAQCQPFGCPAEFRDAIPFGRPCELLIPVGHLRTSGQPAASRGFPLLCLAPSSPICGTSSWTGALLKRFLPEVPRSVSNPFDNPSLAAFASSFLESKRPARQQAVCWCMSQLLISARGTCSWHQGAQ